LSEITELKYTSLIKKKSSFKKKISNGIKTFASELFSIWMADDSICSSTYHDSDSMPVQRNARKSQFLSNYSVDK